MVSGRPPAIHYKTSSACPQRGGAPKKFWKRALTVVEERWAVSSFIRLHTLRSVSKYTTPASSPRPPSLAGRQACANEGSKGDGLRIRLLDLRFCRCKGTIQNIPKYEGPLIRQFTRPITYHRRSLKRGRVRIIVFSTKKLLR